MALEILVKTTKPINTQSPDENEPLMGEYVNLAENNGLIEIHQNGNKIAEVPGDKTDEVRKFKPLGARISGIKLPNHLIIQFLN